MLLLCSNAEIDEEGGIKFLERLTGYLYDVQ